MSNRGRPKTPDILTPREYKVLALLREGLSNREIAERLGVSLAGAKFHVSEIITKLGVESREEAAAWREPRKLLSLLSFPFWSFEPRPAVIRGTAAMTGAIAVALLLLLVVALVGAARGPETSVVLHMAKATPTVEAIPEPQRGNIAGYDTGYVSGGGFFHSIEEGTLTLEEQVGSGTVAYAVDAGTRFLWADDERIRFDSSTDGLAPGLFVTFGFDSPPVPDTDTANGRVSANQTPLDYVIIGYFKYLDGTVLDVDGDVLEVELNPQLRDVGETLFGATNGKMRVRLDPGVDITDVTPSREGLRAGVRVGYAGLVNADRLALAYQLIVQ